MVLVDDFCDYKGRFMFSDWLSITIGEWGVIVIVTLKRWS